MNTFVFVFFSHIDVQYFIGRNVETHEFSSKLKPRINLMAMQIIYYNVREQCYAHTKYATLQRHNDARTGTFSRIGIRYH